MNQIMISESSIRDKIFILRGLQVMVDRDLAELYQVSTKRLNEQVKRNLERFPNDFMFKLTDKEKEELVAKCDHLNPLVYSYQNPYVFTEQGVAMLSAVLRSETAVKVSIQIIKSFVSMRKFIATNAQIFQRLDRVEIKQIESDKRFNKIFNALETHKPKQGVFFDGQIFDAYELISKLIKDAKKSIMLVDNYVDESVLTLFTKRKKGVNLTIFTKEITEQMKLDVKKHNSQYSKAEIKKFDKSHDRFLIIDNQVYHFGASLKDLGKKWFGFSRMDERSVAILQKLGGK